MPANLPMQPNLRKRLQNVATLAFTTAAPVTLVTALALLPTFGSGVARAADPAPDNVVIEATAPASVTPGKPFAVTYTVKPVNGFKMNPDAPDKSVVRVSLTPQDGLTLDKKEADGTAFADVRKEPKLTISATAAKPGSYTLASSFKAIICTAEVCTRPTVAKSVTVVAK